MYSGSCHCGRIAFEVEGECLEANECNCSHCSRKGYLLWFIPRGQLRLKSPEASLSTYQFNKHVINHHFCPNCGCAPFATGAGKSGAAMAAVNVRCLADFDLAGIKRIPVDGRSH
jgi:hypothetical protein